MSVCNRADADFDAAACEAAGGIEHGGGSDSGEGTWTQAEQGTDGKWWQYNSKLGTWRETTPPPTADSLEGDIRGLLPLDPDAGNDVPYYLRDPNQSPGAEFSSDPRGNLIDNRYLEYGAGGLTGMRPGGELDATERKRVLGSYGAADGSGDPYAGARFAEQIRAQRISEAMQAIDNRRMAINAAQQARLEGAGFAVSPNMTHFPGLGPQSPIVRAGLADPFPIQQRVAFDPNLVMDTGNQWQQDLARIRAGSQ
jgi:hypothetical protein